MSVNLLPPPPPAVRRRFLLAAVAIAAWGLAGVLLAADWYAASQAARLLALRVAQASVESETLNRELAGLTAKQQTLALGAAIAKAEVGAPNPSAPIASLVARLPRTAAVQVLNYASGYVNLQVHFPNMPTAAAAMSRIARDGMFTNPVVQSVTAGPTGVLVSMGLKLAPESSSTSTQGATP